MAKIIYFKSPLDRKPDEIISEKSSVREILVRLGIENDPLSVSLNGVTPDDFDIAYVPHDADVIEIRRPVEGGGSSENKSTIGTIIQIAAIATATFFTGGVALAIVLGGNIVAGIFQKWSADLTKGPNAGSTDSEIDSSSNGYSLATATNDARQLSPMTLVMGSHRLAPDVFGQPFKSVYNEQNTLAYQVPYLSTYYPGGTSSNGADAVGNNWATMPANFIAAGFPKYAIKIAPYWWNLPPGTISVANNNMIINEVKNKYLSGDYLLGPGNIGSSTVAPLVVYHAGGDPYSNRYNFFFILARLFEGDPGGLNYNAYLNNLFTNTPSNSLYFYWSLTPLPTFAKEVIKVYPNIPYFFPSNVVASDVVTDLFNKYYTLLLSMNGGSFAGSKTLSYPIEMQTGKIGLTTVIKEGVPYSAQAFNYGLGDVEVSGRAIGALDVETLPAFSDLAGFKPIEKTPGIFQWKWWPLLQGPGGQSSVTFDEVLQIDNKTLKNQSSPAVPIQLTDMDQYNFTYIEGKIGMDSFSCTIAGNLYSTNTSTGFGSNVCDIELQWKFKEELAWRALPLQISFPFYPGQVLSLTNNNTKRITYKFGFTTDDVANETRPDSIVQVRIRKLTLDSVNNDGSNICTLGLTDVCFYRSFDFADRKDHRKPLNLEALYVTSNVSDYAQTNKYTAIVEGKCWVYDFDLETWSWAKTRNPAFWFLFFARGGFLNDLSDGTYTAPYSPTIGWVNYPGHPDSTDHIFGVGLLDAEIDIEKIIEWAAFCEDSELNFDLVLQDDTSSSDVLERIANVGRGSVTYIKGLLSVIYEDPEAIPTCLFGMGNIVAGSFAVDYMVADPVTKVVGRFTNRETWETEEVEAIVPYTTDPDDKVIEVTLEGVTDLDQAQREVNILAARQYFQRRTYSWACDPEGMLANRGDVAYLGHDSTQYGYSGRVKNFIVEGGLVVAIETSSILNADITHVTIRSPDGTMNIYACTVDGSRINFTGTYPFEEAPFQISNNVENALSNYPRSIVEDFIFIAGAKSTPGKTVRISERRAKEDGSFEFSAIDEDPAMWAYEFDDVIYPESFDDAEVVLSLANIKTEDLGEGLIKIYWENVNGDFIRIINEANSLPVEANGAFSFTGGEVIIELVPNQKYTLSIQPFSIGTPYKAENVRVKVWPR